jgi:hypothetical protein
MVYLMIPKIHKGGYIPFSHHGKEVYPPLKRQCRALFASPSHALHAIFTYGDF